MPLSDVELTPFEMALRYASLGWLVIPVTGKRPTLNDWPSRASSDQATVAKMFATTAHDGVGVALGQRSGLIDFDCDSSEAEESLQKLFDGNVPQTPKFQSARGEHRLFKWCPDLPRGSIKLMIDGLEIRTGDGAKGAQSVFPPSGSRKWIVWPEDCNLAEVPPIVIERINRRYAEIHKPKKIEHHAYDLGSAKSDDRLNVPRWLASRGREIVGRTDGSDGVTRWQIECPGADRHTTGNSFRDCCITQDASGRLGGSCFHSSCGMSSWQELKVAIGEPGYDDYREFEQAPVPMVDPMDYPTEAAEPATVLAEGTLKVIEPAPKPLFEVDELSFWNPGGTIQLIMSHNLSSAYKRQPELAMFGALALFATVIGRKVQDDRGARPNIYLIGLAPSGSGKEHARQINKMILALANRKEMLSDNLASDAGLLRQMARSASSLFQLDEYGRMLSTLTGASKNPHLYRIPTMLMQLFSSASTIFLGANHADGKNDVAVSNPNCVVYATTVPASFFASLTKESLSDGFLNRHLILEITNSDPDPQDEPTNIEDVPAELIDVIKWWITYQPGPNDIEPTARRLVTTPESKAAYKMLETTVRKRHAAEVANGTEIWSRCYEYGRKLGLLHQLSVDRHAVEISGESARWGCQVALRLTDRMEQMVEENISDGVFDAIGKKLRNFIKGEESGRTRSQISRHVRNLPPRELTEALSKLIETGDITLERVPSAKGPTTEVYRSMA